MREHNVSIRLVPHFRRLKFTAAHRPSKRAPRGDILAGSSPAATMAEAAASTNKPNGMACDTALYALLSSLTLVGFETLLHPLLVWLYATQVFDLPSLWR